MGGRHLALPIEEYDTLTTWGRANDAWIRVAQEVGAAAVLDALGRAGLAVDDVDALIFVTVTGVATPSVDARLMNRLGLPAGVRRMPIFGLGCVAGAAGISRAADYVRAYPDQVAVLLSVELCSLTLQREDLSIPNLIASGLFGDGAAAVLVVGDGHRAVGQGPGGTGDRRQPLGLLPRLRGGHGLEHLGGGVPDRPLGRRAAGGPRSPAGRCRRFPCRARPDPRRHRLLGLPPRRTQGAGGHGGDPGAPPGGPRRHLEEPPRGGQPLFDLGAPGFKRRPWTTTGRRPAPTASSSPWAPGSARSWCCCAGRSSGAPLQVPLERHPRPLYSPRGARRGRAAVRAADRQPQPAAAPEPGGGRGRGRSLSLDGPPPHRLARRLSARGLAPRPAVPAGSGGGRPRRLPRPRWRSATG